MWYNNDCDVLYLAPLEPGSQNIDMRLSTKFQGTLRLNRVAIALSAIYSGRLNPFLKAWKLFSTYEEIGRPTEVFVVEDHCGHHPTEARISRQSMDDPWTYLPLEHGATINGDFPISSRLQTIFGNIKVAELSKKLGTIFREELEEARDEFHDDSDDGFSESQFFVPGAYPSIRHIMVMKASHAHETMRAKMIHSEALQELEKNKVELEEIRLKVAAVEKKIEEGEGRVRAAQISADYTVVALLERV